MTTLRKTQDKQKDVLHTINNLLTTINLSGELLQKELYGPLTTKQKQCLKGIVTDAKKIQRLLKKLGD